VYDWSFYVLCVIGVIYGVLRRKYEAESLQTENSNAAVADAPHAIPIARDRAFH
jgi:hypothetical protein